MGSVRGSREHDRSLIRLTIDRPTGNVFTGELMRELTGLIRDAAQDRALRLVLIEAEGRHFSYGAAVDEHTPDRVATMLADLRDLVMAIAASPVPVAALVQGKCLGGAFEVVLACHFLFAAQEARFAVPEVRLGVFPPAAAALLPRRATQALADRMIIGGEELAADDLKEGGLVHGVFPAAELRPRVDAWFAANLGRFSASALRETVRAARRGFLRGLEQELKDLEHDYLTRLQGLADSREGISAFIERRTPAWSHA